MIIWVFLLIALRGVNQSQAEDQITSIRKTLPETNFCEVIYTADGEEQRTTIDTREEFTPIFTILLIPDSGTNFLITLNFVWIEKGTNRFPGMLNGSLSVEAYSSTNETPETCIGSRSWKIDFDPKSTATNLAPFIVARSQLDENRSIYFCQLPLMMPMKPGIINSDYPPEAIEVWLANQPTSTFWHYDTNNMPRNSWIPSKAKMEKELKPISTTKTNLLTDMKRAQVSVDLPTKSNNKIKMSGAIGNSNTVPALGIVLSDGYVLINTSPNMTNGIIEEANPQIYPLVWQPVLESSNTSEGWQLPLKPGAKLFRLKISDLQP